MSADALPSGAAPLEPAPQGAGVPSRLQFSGDLLEAVRAVNRYHAARIGMPLPADPAHEGQPAPALRFATAQTA